jgi:hypothetical protein
MPLTAKFDGKCPSCEEKIVAGVDEIEKAPDGAYVHADCLLDHRVSSALARSEPAKPAGEWTPDGAKATSGLLARYAAAGPAPAPVTMSAAEFFAAPGAPAPSAAPADPNAAALEFFATPGDTSPSYVTKEEEADQKVERDQWDRPLILQPDGSKRPYNRASSYGGQLDDHSKVEEWAARQVVRGIAIALRAGRAPAFLDAIDERLFDPWEDQQSKDKKLLNSLVDRAQDMAGSNLKSQLGTDIHYATELVDLGESLDAGLRDFEPGRRKHLAERADAYWKKIQEYRIKWDSVETFGVQDELEVAGTWDRRGYVPWWPEHAQVIGDVKTSSTMDFAGITYAVQLATYAHMCAYDIATGTRTPHDDMNERWALIIHVERHMGGGVELYPVNVAWGWRHARLARQVIQARREGRSKAPGRAVISRLDDREAAIMSAQTREELRALAPEAKTWPKWLREKAKKKFESMP